LRFILNTEIYLDANVTSPVPAAANAAAQARYLAGGLALL
jgi:hypothetical protein